MAVTGMYVDRAVSALAEKLRNDLVAGLRAYETILGESPGYLPDPESGLGVLEERIDNDQRSPGIQVYDEDWEWEDQRNRLMNVECTIRVSILTPFDAQDEGGKKARRYMTVITRLIQQDPTLGQRGISAYILDGEAAAFREEDRGFIRHARGMGVKVQVHEETA